MEQGPNIDIIKFVGPPIYKYWTYRRKLKEYLNSLVRKKDELQSRKEDIELRLTVELQLGKKPRKEVENWLKKAGKAIRESQDIEDRVSKVNYLCLASIGREIDGKIQEMIEVHNQGSFPNSLVIDAPSNSVMTLPTPELVGETTVKEKIWAYLMGDSVCKIGVCGMRGIGKTTIMKHIHDDLLKEAKFDKVIWITVSKEFDVIKLLEGIAYALNEDLSKLHKDRNTWAAILFKILEVRKRYVLILDGVWQRFFLKDVGIPEPTRGNGCKLVLTTRSIEEARSMGCEIIKVEHLPEKEALDLFLNNVGRDLMLIPTLHSTLRQVVEQCAGLPLVIVTVANSLMGEYDIHMWNNALNELKGHKVSVKGMEDYELLKFSYNCLKGPKIKHCFLYCVLYPEDFEISKEELIEYWIVEGLIDEMGTRQATYSMGHVIFNRLENICLLKGCQGGTHENA